MTGETLLEDDRRDACPTAGCMKKAACANNPSVGQASRLSDKHWKRHLPHYEEAGSYYFITFTTDKRKQFTVSEKDCIFKALLYLDVRKYELYAAVVMNDHAHIVIRPAEPLSKIMHSVKSYTAHEINKTAKRSGKVWQDEYYDRVIRSEREFQEKLLYTANNPIKSKFAETHADYEWLFVKGWIERGG
jgi:REP element-mobilizing transposase RayT